MFYKFLIHFSICKIFEILQYLCYYGGMAESLNSKRAFLPRGEQRKFLLQSKGALCVTWKEMAKISGVSVRNLNDWRNEKISMSLGAVRRICKKRKCEIPKEMIVKGAYWYAKKGAQAGGKAIIEKYGIVGGNQEYRKKKWREWWEKEGKFKLSKITETLPFKRPKFSKELAEFVGVMLGDGGISKYQFTVSLNRVSDKGYSKFVQKLIRSLFEVPVGLYFDKQFLAERITVSRSTLVTYLVDTLGLKKGNKVRQGVDIPSWIKENKQYSIACVRGLIDTDGCTIIHRYLSKGKRYCYKKVSFTNRSYPLIQSVSDVFSNIGIKNRIVKDKWDVRIEAKKDVESYFRLVGTHNPKHRKRYKMA